MANTQKLPNEIYIYKTATVAASPTSQLFFLFRSSWRKGGNETETEADLPDPKPSKGNENTTGRKVCF